MILPVPVTQAQPAGPDPVTDLKVALKLLSGKDCVRDAAQAQVILLHLAEGSDAVLASDAGRIIKAGVANDWFGAKAPHHFELERIAEASLGRKSTAKELQLKIALLAGVLSLAVGIGVFFAVQGGSPEGAPVIVGIAVLAILGLMVFLKKKDA